MCFHFISTEHRSTSTLKESWVVVFPHAQKSLIAEGNELDMLKIVLCLVVALSLTNALPVRNRFYKDFDDSAREAIPRKRSHFEDLYDSYLRRRQPSHGEWPYSIPYETHFQLFILLLTLICGYFVCVYRPTRGLSLPKIKTSVRRGERNPWYVWSLFIYFFPPRKLYCAKSNVFDYTYLFR